MSQPLLNARSRPRPDRRPWAFIRHYLEMVMAMFVGMVALQPLWPNLPHVLEIETLAMATNMNLGMAAWMAVRHEPAVAIARMAVAMYLPFIVLFAPYRLGWLSYDTVLTAGHLLMLAAMAAVMLLPRTGPLLVHRTHRKSASHDTTTQEVPS
jgi:hypothetical protein